MTDTANPDETPRSKRQQVLLGAEISRPDGSNPTRHRIKDLSATGARVDRAGALEPRAMVLITVGALEAIAATVVWVKGDVAGLEFAAPIDPDAARSKALVSSASPPAPGLKSPVLRPGAAPSHPQPTAGWIHDRENPYRK
ncbi:MAG: PilZ domain-containing protein [Pseudomonadota bacterium]